MALYPLNSCHYFLTIILFLLLRWLVDSIRIAVAVTITGSGNLTLPPPLPFATLKPLFHGFMPAFYEYERNHSEIGRSRLLG